VVPGENAGNPLVIRPGYEDDAIWTHVDNGWITPGWSCTAEQFFASYAMLPGWQRWIPRYRYGLIQAIHNDGTADVLIDATVSSAKHRYTLQPFGVNELQGQDTLLESVPFQYMNCDWEAFSVDDHVVVELREQESGPFSATGWGDPWIIGFVTNPRTCLLFVESGLADFHWVQIAVAQNTEAAADLYYPKQLQDLVGQYGGIRGEFVETDTPLWHDWTGVLAGGPGSRFRGYGAPPLESLSITTDRSSPTDSNRYLSADAQYMQMALPGKLKFAVAAAMGAKQYGFGWNDPYCKRPNKGRTFAIITDVVYPGEATESSPVRLEYYLARLSAGEPLEIWALDYDTKNPDVALAVEAFLDLGPISQGESESQRYERLRIEANILGTIQPPDFDEISATPDFFTSFDLDVTGNPEDYGFQVDWMGRRFAIVTRETSFDGLGQTEYHTARYYYGTIAPRKQKHLGNTVFDIEFNLLEGPTNYTPKHLRDHLFRYNFKDDEHEWRSYVTDPGSYQGLDADAVPVYVFFDPVDRLSIVRHSREIPGSSAQPSNWNTFAESIIDCNPLAGNHTSGELLWYKTGPFDVHGYYMERERTSGQGDMEIQWNFINIETTGGATEYVSQRHEIWADSFSEIVVDHDVVDSWTGSSDWTCTPTSGPFNPPTFSGYDMTIIQGSGRRDFQQNTVTDDSFRSILIIPGFDSSRVYAGYLFERRDEATHRQNIRNCAIAVRDDPGKPPDHPGSGTVWEWRLNAPLTGFRNNAGTGSITYISGRPRWRIEGVMTLTSHESEDLITSEINVWINLGTDTEPETTHNADTEPDVNDVKTEALGRWNIFRDVSSQNTAIEAFRSKFSNNYNGVWTNDFNSPDDPSQKVGRSDGIPLRTYNWDICWPGSG
jgi:hypothetical protein